MSRARKKRIRQIRRNRRIAAVLFLVLTALNISMLGHTLSVNAEKPETYKYYTDIRVKSGETLWDIAMEYMTEEYSTPSDYIREVKRINNIGEQIQYGQYLTVPYYSEVQK
ncbi:MAG: LysM peptidoglycan-binding domain-containing protein [Marvinbryantia sp.]|jgi:cell division protein YceG involved in septum cleavage